MLDLIPSRERRQLDRFRSEMDGLFDRFFDWRPFDLSIRKSEWMPAVDVSETPKQIVVKAEIPGMEAKDIDILLNGRVLTLKGEKKTEQEEKEENYHKVERSYGAFSRSFELPADVDANKVKTSYKDGVLKLSLPKTKEQSVKKIEIKTT
ncbi:MAG: molecular chaperone [Nitrospira bacterium SG8_3]|nr:MAG: molecular chaperone [Nitrospira bacterium SG8_3]